MILHPRRRLAYRTWEALGEINRLEALRPAWRFDALYQKELLREEAAYKLLSLLG